MQITSSSVYATRIGGKTMDQDAQGGNPFATALIQACAEPPRALSALLAAVAAQTYTRSSGRQRPIWRLAHPHSHWEIQQSLYGPRERRVALVLVVYDYSATNLGYLAGAAWDERRIAALLAQHGFSVTQGVGSTKREVNRALRAFSKCAAGADAAIIYCTGHGIHAQGETFLLPSDYPGAGGYTEARVLKYAVSVGSIAGACQAQHANITFFAGCRTRCPES